MKTKTQKTENAITAESSAETEVTGMLRRGGRRFLCSLKQKSLRTNNSWFRVLSLEKRRFIDAVIQTVNKIKSPLLVKALTPLAETLLQAIGGMRGLMGQLAYQMQYYGCPLAKRISQYAQNWGYKAAEKWADDPGFIRYLSVIEINNLPTYRCQ
jgi:hypothetical protein